MEVGYNSEYGKLQSVFLHIPRRGELEMMTADEAMYEFQPNYDVVLEEVSALWDLLNKLGIEVHTDMHTPDYLYHANAIYMRDVAAVLDDSIILGNLRYDVRKGEELNLIKYLRKEQYAGKLIEFSEDITFEGADMLRTKPDEVILSVGNRTSPKVAETLQQLYPHINFKTVEALPEGIPQHILGAHMILDADTLLIRSELSQETLGYKNVITLSEFDEVSKNYATNILVIGPREIIMADDCPQVKAMLECHQGMKIHTCKMSEIRKMAGGFACMTLPLKRELV